MDDGTVLMSVREPSIVLGKSCTLNVGFRNV